MTRQQAGYMGFGGVIGATLMLITATIWAQVEAPAAVGATNTIQSWGILIGIIVTALVTLFNTWDNRKSRAVTVAATTAAQASAASAADAVIDAATKVEAVRTDLSNQSGLMEQQLSKVVEETGKIHVAVNSERTAMQEELKKMNEVILQLTKDKADLEAKEGKRPS
jgi:hypothetical protein